MKLKLQSDMAPSCKVEALRGMGVPPVVCCRGANRGRGRAFITFVALICLSSPVHAEFPDPAKFASALLDVLKNARKITYEEESALGEAMCLQSMQAAGRLIEDEQVLEYVALVGRTVAQSSYRPHTPYHFAVCENPDPNAFSIPGGFIFMTTGLLKLVKSEDELAGVLGHELSHVALQHAIKAARKAKIWAATGKAAMSFAETEAMGVDYSNLVKRIVEIVMEKGYEFGNEIDADELAIEFAYRAGYDPRGLRNFVNTLAEHELAKENFVLFKTHRDAARRVQEMDRYIQEKGYGEVPAAPARVARFEKNLASRLK